MTQESIPNHTSLQDIVAQYPAIALLADAPSYAKTSGEVEGLSGEQLRSAKSISISRKMAANDVASLLGEQAEALQPGYAIFSDIVHEGVTALGEGDFILGQARMETVLSAHDLVKSASVSGIIATTYGITDHDMGLARLVTDNFRALDERIDPHVVDSLRSAISDDEVLRNFFGKERGIDPGFNVGRHLQGEADFVLFKKTVHEVDPVTMAEFTLDLLGADGNSNPNGPVKFSNIPPAFNGIATGLKKLMDAQDTGSSSEDLYAIWQELSYPVADLARLGLDRSTPDDIAVTRLAFMGCEHQKADIVQAREDITSLRTSFNNLDVGTKQEVAEVLQDEAGLDLGFAPHVMEALRQQVGAAGAYKHFLDIIGQVCESEVVRSRSSDEVLTINLDNKFDWRHISDSNNVHVTISERDANGVVNAYFEIR